MPEACDRCGAPLMEIDHYGEPLTGCLGCNIWRGKQLVIQLPEEDVQALRKLRRSFKEEFIAEYEDGTQEVFAVLQSASDQGPGALEIARIVAGEWQRDGKLKPGAIMKVRRPSIEELIEMYGKGGRG
jgi:hypothetical protein